MTEYLVWMTNGEGGRMWTHRTPYGVQCSPTCTRTRNVKGEEAAIGLGGS